MYEDKDGIKVYVLECMGQTKEAIGQEFRRLYFGKEIISIDMLKTEKEIRENLMISKAELSIKAKILPMTITRIEQGKQCRMETKRKVILALGYKISDKDKIFGD